MCYFLFLYKCKRDKSYFLFCSWGIEKNMWNISFSRRNYFYTTISPLLCYGEYTYDCKLKKFHEMLLTTLAHNQHDVIDVIIFFICIFHSTRINLRAMILRGSAGRICHLENVKSYMSYLQQCTKILLHNYKSLVVLRWIHIRL
jgi:hypothetical protein